ncbi:MAG: hypothetical protein WEB58_13665 [Planctomycetaceae bacterium]
MMEAEEAQEALSDSDLKRIAADIHDLIVKHDAFDLVCDDFADFWSRRYAETKRLDLQKPPDDWPFFRVDAPEPASDPQVRRMILLVIYINHTRFPEFRDRLINLVEPASSPDDGTHRRIAFCLAQESYKIPADDKSNLVAFMHEFESWITAGKKPANRRRRSTGRPAHRLVDTDIKADEAIHDAYKAARSKKATLTYAQFAATYSLHNKSISGDEVKAAVNRHTKRR